MQVFPREIHHVLPLEWPERWVTCDSIGLFLETECQFPSESQDDCDCYREEEYESVPKYWRQGFGLTKLFVKRVSPELINLYRRFVSPVNSSFFFFPFGCRSPPFALCDAGESVDPWTVVYAMVY